MPLVNFVNMHRKINVTRSMLTPKRITELRYWLKGAQNVIPEIPRNVAESEGMASRQMGSDGWFVFNTDVDVKWITFHLQNAMGEKAQIVINRKSNGISG
jgi:hypothetical protein